VPAKTPQELIALAKSQPGKLNFGSSGITSMPRLAGEVFKRRAKIDIVHVPYAGSAPALLSLIANETQLMFSEFVTPAQYLKNGQLKVLAVMSDARLPFAPDVPTVAEAGMPGFTMSVWYGVLARAGTPAHVVNLLNREINEAMADPEIKARLLRDGAEPSKGLSPAEFKAYISSQMTELGKVVQEAKISQQ
jgi:tripartite-type tricarboxylate transporter receptor subunit TctC